MREVVLGCGHQKSLWSIVVIADEQLRSIHGSPRKMVVRSRTLSVEALRPDYEGEFHSFTIHVHLPASELDNCRRALTEIVSVQQADCRLVDETGGLQVQCQPATDGDIAHVHAACDALSAAFELPEVWRVHGEEYRSQHISSETLFRAVTKFKSSDIHLCPGAPPIFRVDGQLRRADNFAPLSSAQILTLIEEIAPEKNWQEFQDKLQCSFIYHQVGLGYSRVSAFTKSGTPHCTLRFLPESIPSFEDLRIPVDSMQRLAKLHFGLVLVTGMTGSGKSTTVASLVDWINQHRSVHVLCIEEPVEFVHKSKKAVVSQRDVPEDVGSFGEAVRGALRHDPDVIVVGEMRDPETIRAAINAAATGHLVISTLHAGTTYEVVNRIVSFFDPVERDLVRLQLRDALKCVICQRLLPKLGGGRMVAMEFMFNDIKYINDAILTGNTAAIKVGMQQTASSSFVFEEHLFKLYKQDLISWEIAREFASDAAMLEQMHIGTYTIPPLDSMHDARHAGRSSH
ncbi:MAG: PilT/PilU family type 4a pilus ATPase [Pirellulaceae bacterium]|nr:PilT/PilU family type 4a pilus ATPase [Pirellulaceae bacterium]